MIRLTWKNVLRVLGEVSPAGLTNSQLAKYFTADSGLVSGLTRCMFLAGEIARKETRHGTIAYVYFSLPLTERKDTLELWFKESTGVMHCSGDGFDFELWFTDENTLERTETISRKGSTKIMCGMSIPVTAYGNNNDMDLLQAIIIKKLQKVWPDMTGLGSRKKAK